MEHLSKPDWSISQPLKPDSDSVSIPKPPCVLCLLSCHPDIYQITTTLVPSKIEINKKGHIVLHLKNWILSHLIKITPSPMHGYTNYALSACNNKTTKQQNHTKIARCASNDLFLWEWYEYSIRLIPNITIKGIFHNNSWKVLMVMGSILESQQHWIWRWFLIWNVNKQKWWSVMNLWKVF